MNEQDLMRALKCCKRAFEISDCREMGCPYYEGEYFRNGCERKMMGDVADLVERLTERNQNQLNQIREMRRKGGKMPETKFGKCPWCEKEMKLMLGANPNRKY